MRSLTKQEVDSLKRHVRMRWGFAPAIAWFAAIAFIFFATSSILVSMDMIAYNSYIFGVVAVVIAIAIAQMRGITKNLPWNWVILYCLKNVRGHWLFLWLENGEVKFSIRGHGRVEVSKTVVLCLPLGGWFKTLRRKDSVYIGSYEPRLLGDTFWRAKIRDLDKWLDNWYCAIWLEDHTGCRDSYAVDQALELLEEFSNYRQDYLAYGRISELGTLHSILQRERLDGRKKLKDREEELKEAKLAFNKSLWLHESTIRALKGTQTERRSTQIRKVRLTLTTEFLDLLKDDDPRRETYKLLPQEIELVKSASA